MTQPRTEQPHQRFPNPESFGQVATDIREVFRLLQPKSHRVVKTAPIASDLNEGEIVFYDDESSTRRLYTKLNGSLRYVALT